MSASRLVRVGVVLTGLALSSLACGPRAAPSTGGVALPDGACRALVLVESDYQSSNVVLSSWAGDALSSSFASSATHGLSGDLVVPTSRLRGREVVLIDRYPAGVVTWLDAESGAARQLSVATGFASNPQDVLELEGGLALVSRFGHHELHGNEPFDAGDDVLVVDALAPSIVASIDLRPALSGLSPSLHPRATRMERDALGRPWVLLSVYDDTFLEAGESRLVSLDVGAREVVHVVPLVGLRGCGGLARSPSGERLAVSCSGAFVGTSEPDPALAGLAVIDVSSAPVLWSSLAASTLGGEPLGFSVAFDGEDRVLVTTFGALFPAEPDRLLEVDLASGLASERWRSTGEPFTLGEVRCEPGCGCVLTDASRGAGALVRWAEPGAQAEVHRSNSGIGLPARYVGGL